MSWSKSANGTAEQVKGTCANWASEQQAIDSSYNNEAATKGHQDQIARCIKVIETFVGEAPDGAQFVIQASGHHDGDAKSDQASVGARYYVPTPVAGA